MSAKIIDCSFGLNGVNKHDLLVLVASNAKLAGVVQSVQCVDDKKGTRVFVFTDDKDGCPPELASHQFKNRITKQVVTFQDLCEGCLTSQSLLHINSSDVVLSGSAQSSSKRKAEDDITSELDLVLALGNENKRQKDETSHTVVKNVEVWTVSEVERLRRFEVVQFLKAERKATLQQIYHDKTFAMQFSNLDRIKMTLTGTAASIQRLKGQYSYEGAMNRAGYFALKGSYLGVEGRFVMFRSALSQPKSFIWFLSFVSGEERPGGPGDTNLLYSDPGPDNCPIPMAEWFSLTRSYADVSVILSVASERPVLRAVDIGSIVDEPCGLTFPRVCQATAVSSGSCSNKPDGASWCTAANMDVGIIAHAPDVDEKQERQAVRALLPAIIQFVKQKRKLFEPTCGPTAAVCISEQEPQLTVENAEMIGANGVYLHRGELSGAHFFEKTNKKGGSRHVICKCAVQSDSPVCLWFLTVLPAICCTLGGAHSPHLYFCKDSAASPLWPSQPWFCMTRHHATDVAITVSVSFSIRRTPYQPEMSADAASFKSYEQIGVSAATLPALTLNLPCWEGMIGCGSDAIHQSAQSPKLSPQTSVSSVTQVSGASSGPRLTRFSPPSVPAVSSDSTQSADSPMASSTAVFADKASTTPREAPPITPAVRLKEVALSASAVPVSVALEAVEVLSSADQELLSDFSLLVTHLFEDVTVAQATLALERVKIVISRDCKTGYLSAQRAVLLCCDFLLELNVRHQRILQTQPATTAVNTRTPLDLPAQSEHHNDEWSVSVLAALFHPLPAEEIETELYGTLLSQVEALGQDFAGVRSVVPISCICAMLHQLITKQDAVPENAVTGVETQQSAATLLYEYFQLMFLYLFPSLGKTEVPPSLFAGVLQSVEQKFVFIVAPEEAAVQVGWLVYRLLSTLSEEEGGSSVSSVAATAGISLPEKALDYVTLLSAVFPATSKPCVERNLLACLLSIEEVLSLDSGRADGMSAVLVVFGLFCDVLRGSYSIHQFNAQMLPALDADRLAAVAKAHAKSKAKLEANLLKLFQFLFPSLRRDQLPPSLFRDRSELIAFQCAVSDEIAVTVTWNVHNFVFLLCDTHQERMRGAPHSALLSSPEALPTSVTPYVALFLELFPSLTAREVEQGLLDLVHSMVVAGLQSVGGLCLVPIREYGDLLISLCALNKSQHR